MRELYGTSEWFESLFKSNDDDPWGHNWRGIELYRYDVIMKLLRGVFTQPQLNSDFKTLDIGCSTGDFTNCLYKLNNNVIGMDISETAIQRAVVKFKHIDFRIGSLTCYRFQNNIDFDLITCLEVLYYLDDIMQKILLEEVSRLLKERGTVLFTSVIGAKPYFDPMGLIDILKEYFEIKTIGYYGSYEYSRIEKLLFDKYQQINKVQRLFLTNRHEIKKKNNSDKAMKLLVANIVCFIVEYRILVLVTSFSLQILKKIIRIGLHCKFPPKVFNWLSGKLSSRRTHTLVLATKLKNKCI